MCNSLSLQIVKNNLNDKMNTSDRINYLIISCEECLQVKGDLKFFTQSNGDGVIIEQFLLKLGLVHKITHEVIEIPDELNVISSDNNLSFKEKNIWGIEIVRAFELSNFTDTVNKVRNILYTIQLEEVIKYTHNQWFGLEDFTSCFDGELVSDNFIDVNCNAASLIYDSKSHIYISTTDFIRIATNRVNQKDKKLYVLQSNFRKGVIKSVCSITYVEPAHWAVCIISQHKCAYLDTTGSNINLANRKLFQNFVYFFAGTTNSNFRYKELSPFCSNGITQEKYNSGIISITAIAGTMYLHDNVPAYKFAERLTDICNDLKNILNIINCYRTQYTYNFYNYIFQIKSAHVHICNKHYTIMNGHWQIVS